MTLSLNRIRLVQQVPIKMTAPQLSEVVIICEAVERAAWRQVSCPPTNYCLAFSIPTEMPWYVHKSVLFCDRDALILILFTSSGFATYLEIMISIWRTNELGVDKTESTFGATDLPWIVSRSGWDELWTNTRATRQCTCIVLNRKQRLLLWYLGSYFRFSNGSVRTRI